jgi:hypothetical protein
METCSLAQSWKEGHESTMASAGNSIHDDAKSYVSLDLSHDCGSLWDGSDNENNADDLGNR